MPSALLRSPPSSNMFITIESAAGTTIAAPSPCSPRIAIKNESVVASAQASECGEDAEPEHDDASASEQVGGASAEEEEAPKVSA